MEISAGDREHCERVQQVPADDGVHVRDIHRGHHPDVPEASDELPRIEVSQRPRPAADIDNLRLAPADRQRQDGKAARLAHDEALVARVHDHQGELHAELGARIFQDGPAEG